MLSQGSNVYSITEIEKDSKIDCSNLASSVSYLASSPRTCARTRGDDLKRLAMVYCDVLGRATCCRSVLTEMAQFMMQGALPEIIEHALTITLDAPRPSWAYARAIVRRYIREGTFTLEAVENARKRPQEPSQSKKINDLGYAQRKELSNPHYYDDIFVNLDK